MAVPMLLILSVLVVSPAFGGGTALATGVEEVPAQAAT
jgi:hypothetical protein